DALQLRAKNLAEADVCLIARQIARVAQSAGAPFIINDFPQLVAATAADGAHVGQDDLPVSEARLLASRQSTLNAQPAPRPLIGKSTHSLAQAVAAEREGADYI